MIVESGNLVNEPGKLEFIVTVLKEMRYDAVGVGETDLRACGEKFFSVTAAGGLPVLDASPGAAKSAVPFVVKSVDGVNVGIFSFSAVLPSPDTDQYAFRKSLYAAYKTARERSDILIVLDQANVVTREWLERNGPRLGAPDIVVGGVLRSGKMDDEIAGKTHLAPTSVQGKSVGVVDIEIAPGQDPRFSVRKISIEATVAENEGIAKRIRDIMGQASAAVQEAARSNSVTAATAPAVSGKPYYPSALCKTCHIKEYQDWSKSKHAVALRTLVDQDRAVPECLNCHSEMYIRLQRVDLTASETGGVECASCHANSLPHGMERKNTTVRAKADRNNCLVCHDKKWSPNYNEEAYIAKVSHKGVGEPKAAEK